MSEQEKATISPQGIICGLFSKKEAAQLIANGTTHLHSSTLGTRDACAKVTNEMLRTGKNLPYPWEVEDKPSNIILACSADRQRLTRQVITETGVGNRRELSEKLSLVMEELMTNAIYHSYLDAGGEQKYLRQHIVRLKEAERVSIEYSGGKKGLYISVTDHGGTIEFNHIARSFQRCYGEESAQIENKSSGAGLGLYMVFELVTHLKVVCMPGKQSVVSCWIPDNRSYDPDYFSFNFFDGRNK